MKEPYRISRPPETGSSHQVIRLRQLQNGLGWLFLHVLIPNCRSQSVANTLCTLPIGEATTNMSFRFSKTIKPPTPRSTKDRNRDLLWGFISSNASHPGTSCVLGLNPFRPCILSRWEKLGLPGFHWKLKFNAMFPEHVQSYPAQAKQSISARANSQNKHPAWWFQLTPESVERGIMGEKIHFKHDETTSAEWRTNENPADLWWDPWDFINSRRLLGAGVACVGFMFNYSPIIWHTLTYEKHMVFLGIWSTFIVILFHIYCI